MQLEFHPLANVFPMIEGEELDALAQSIRENGLREPIVIHEGQILDGRNRYRACKSIGIEPITTRYDGDNPTAYVIDMNIHRRHLNASQRAMVAARLATRPYGNQPTRHAEVEKTTSSPPPPTTDEAAALLNVSRDSVINARRVIAEASPEEIAEVEAGDLSVARVARQLRQGEDETARKKYDPKAKGASTKQFHAALWHGFKDALNSLNGMPHPEDAVKIIRAHNRGGYIEERLSQALQYLKDFNDEWNRDGTQANREEADGEDLTNAADGGWSPRSQSA